MPRRALCARTSASQTTEPANVTCSFRQIIDKVPLLKPGCDSLRHAVFTMLWDLSLIASAWKVIIFFGVECGRRECFGCLVNSIVDALFEYRSSPDTRFQKVTNQRRRPISAIPKIKTLICTKFESSLFHCVVKAEIQTATLTVTTKHSCLPWLFIPNECRVDYDFVALG